MARSMQTSLSGGELSPSLHSHADLQKYATGLALCENWFVQAQGGISTRAGFQYVGTSVDSTSLMRLIPFEFNIAQTYALAFTDQKMRVVMDGGMVLEPSTAITGATQANPVVITEVGHAYATSDDLYLANIVGMTELNGRTCRITKIDANSYSLDGIDGTAYAAYTSGGTAARVFTLATPYLQAELFGLKFTQSADVMTLTHPNHAPQELARTDHHAWTLAPITFAAGIDAPVAGLAISQVGTGGGSNNKTYRYVVTSVGADGAESIASAIKTTGAVSSLSTTYGTKLSWTTVTGAAYYNIYKEKSLNSGIFGWIGECDEDGSPEFQDFNLGPDMSMSPPTAENPFNGAGNYPGCATYHDQRLCFGGSSNQPQTTWLTKTGDFDNMDVSRPTRADDAITATLAARQVNEIRHLLSLDDLLVFTSGGEWKAAGDSDGVMSPSTFSFRSQGFRGCSNVPPVVIGETALYIQARGSRVRDLRYAFEDDKYSGNDLTVMARHLFEKHTIVDWCYAQEPYSIVWAVRDDGKLLSMTYLKEHNISAWTHHTTDGEVESVCCIAEADQDAVYAVVKRNINGADVRHVERMANRQFASIDDAFCVDAGLTYSGAATTTITGLHHLEGETIVGLADGNVISGLTVANGSITLPNAAEKVHIGLPYNCDFQTLEVNFQNETVQSRKKQVARVALRVVESRGLSVGRDIGSMFEIKERTPAMAYGNIPAQTIEEALEITPTWNDYGKVFVRQSYPLPASVIAVIPEVVLGS